MSTPATRARHRARADAAITAPPRRITPREGALRRVVLRTGGREWDITTAIEGDTPWELTTDGAATVTLPVRSPDDSLLAVLTDESLLARDGVRVLVDSVAYVLSGVSGDGAGLYSLTFEDEVAWRLRQFTKFLAANRSQTTRAGFVRRLVDEASRRPLAPLRAFIPEERDRQPVAATEAP